MSTCFLFTHKLSDEGCLSLTLDERGELQSPLALRNFSEIKALQSNAETFIVASSQLFSLHRIQLPWLAESKARAAIPFALEDRLAQNLDLLHFAFDRNHYQDNHYLVAVGDKNYLQQLIHLFDQHQIHFTSITLDWFALKKQEIALMDSFCLVNDNHFQGSLSADLLPFYQGKWTEEESIFFFPDSDKSQITASETQHKKINEASYVWIAQRLLKTKAINLCQGDLEHGNTQVQTKRLYQIALGVGLLWLLCFIGANALKIHFLNKDLKKIDNEIVVIYREFFPNARQVISPKFRINQLLKTKQSNSDLSFWILINKLSSALKQNLVTVNQIRFQNQSLQVTLATDNFESLEDFQTKLLKDQVKVKQTQASTLNQQVVSTLELTL